MTAAPTKRRRWSRAEDQLLRRLIEDGAICRDIVARLGRTISAVYNRIETLRLGERRGSYAHRMKCSRANKGRRFSPRTEFRKGHVPWIAGKKGIRLSPATEFKKGCMRGEAARRYRHIGFVTIRNDKGRRYRWIKIKDDGRPRDRWIPYARWLWLKECGPIPPGWFVVHADGNTLHDAVANYRLVTCGGHIKLQRQRDPSFELRRVTACTSPRSRAKRRTTLAQRKGIKAAIRAAESAKRRATA